MKFKKLLPYLIIFLLLPLVACQTEAPSENLADTYEQTAKTGLIKLGSNNFFFVKDRNQKNTLFEYKLKATTATKTNRTFNFDYHGHALINQQILLFGPDQVSIYNTKNDTIAERVKFLPTPKSDRILLGFQLDQKILCLTAYNNEIILYHLVEENWKIENQFSIKDQFVPQQNIEAILFNNSLYLFWYINDSVCYINTESKVFNNIINSMGKLNNPYFWKQKNDVFFADFDKSKQDQPAFFVISGLGNKPTLVKNTTTFLPPFNSPIKTKGFTPFFLNEQSTPEAYYYGSINGVPVLINDENSELPTKPTEQISKDVNQNFITFMGGLIGSIFIFSLLFKKITIAWESKIKVEMIPTNAIFFGPTIHRGLAVFLDLQVIFFFVIGVILFFPMEVKFDFISRLDPNNLNNLQTDSLKIYGVFYMVHITYCTLSEYYKGGTFGKLILGLEVRSDLTLKKPTFAQVFTRNLLPKISDILIIASNLMISFSRKKKSLHDHIGNTVVLYKRLNDKLGLQLDISKLKDHERKN